MGISPQQKHLLLFNQQRIGALLRSLVLAKGGVYFPMQETSGSVAVATNPALDLGRDLLVKDFTGGLWAAFNTGSVDDSDSFTTTGGGGVRANDPAIEVGKTYIARVKGTSTAANVNVNDFGNVVIYKAITAGGAFDETFTFTAANSNGITFQHAVAGTTDIDWPNTTIKQTDIAASSSFPGAELFVTANAASDPAGTEADATTGWAKSAGAVALTSDSSVKSTGGFSIKAVFAGNGHNISFDLDAILTVGKRYRLILDTRHLGSGGEVDVALGSTVSDNSNTLITLTNTDTSFQTLLLEFTHSAASRYLLSREDSGTNDGGLYFDNISITEANPLNGDITGATVGVDAGRFLGVGEQFDGLVDFLGISSAEINSVLNPTQGTLLAFARVSGVGVWTDGIDRFIAHIYVDDGNRVTLSRSGLDNQLNFLMSLGGVNSLISKINISTAGWMQLAITWDKDADQVIAYFNGVKEGSTLTGLGTWVGNLLSTRTVIGAASTVPGNIWDGDITQVALLTEVLTAAEIARIARAGGVA